MKSPELKEFWPYSFEFSLYCSNRQYNVIVTSLFVESEGPNKPNAGSNAAHASKAVRMKHRA